MHSAGSACMRTSSETARIIVAAEMNDVVRNINYVCMRIFVGRTLAPQQNTQQKKWL